MQFKITNGAFSYGGNEILKDINFEINDKEKIAVVGKNGCGKTTLLKLVSGELELDRDNSFNSQIIKAGIKEIGTLSQIAFTNNDITLIEEIRSVYSDIINLKCEIDELAIKLETEHNDETIKEFTNKQELFNNLGGYYFEKEYETVIKKFGFSEEDKLKKLSEFSGGQRTKIAFIKLLLSKPDILLLDEPTNHLDIESVEWLEEYIKSYPKSVVVVSHDRMFLDKTVDTVYEIEYGKTTRYAGNYTCFAKQKKINRELQQKQYEAQQKEIEHLEGLAERFRYKATKAAMVQSKLKVLERMDIIEEPSREDSRTFYADFTPTVKSFKDVLKARDLIVGYDKPLIKINVDIKRCERIGIVGNNGTGKSTFLKTVVGTLPAVSGDLSLGKNVTIGYFDQQIAAINSSYSVLDDFWGEFPTLTETEARNALAAFRFCGEDVYKTINMLSGGEKVRLSLCKIFQNKPNFLVLDEPTNHMDIVGKEALEEILLNFDGTVLFVSHDRYFVQKIATSLLAFDGADSTYFPYGYDQYIENKSQNKTTADNTTSQTKKERKQYTTPGKEKAKLERQIKKTEEQI
ncbi:MAG: ABC-F family ATP-binding cassette domain-containing protein, partial [Clostridia bacterium]|nr:ABC-F family ATP-binding cassette domain-containing protein [Clostridia bacterium]